jgi:hypothetical protein
MILVYAFVTSLSRERKLTDSMMQDVTEIIGTGKVDLGFKAMIHTLAVSVDCIANVPQPRSLISDSGQGS